MRDRADNCVIVCSIENLDPMGVHTGDSITVAPAQTLSDVEYQRMRDAAFACIRRVGVETGGSNVQFALDPDQRRHGHHRDEPAGVALVGAGLEGHRLPDRQDRRQARRRLHARRDPQRHHQGHAGQLRADHRLRRHQGAPLGVREVPRQRRACSARRCSRWGRRWRSAARSRSRCRRPCARSSTAGSAWPATRARRPSTTSTTRSCSRRAAIGTPDRPFQLEAALRRGISVEVLAERTRVDPWFLDQILAIVEERGRARRGRASRAWTAGLAAGQAPRLRRRPARLAVVGAGGRGACRPPGRRRAGHVQDRRHLRGRVRGQDAVPLLHLRGRGRGHPLRAREGAHPRLRSEPHRAGHRVRLLLRARQLRPRRRRLRDGDAQLQPGDGVHRLRHLRPPLLRAAHPRGRPQRDRGRAGLRHAQGRHRQPRRPDAAQAVGSLPEGLVLGTSPESIDLAEDRERWNALCARLEIPQPAGGTATTLEQAQAIVDKIGYPVLMRPSYVLGGRAMEIVYDDETLKTGHGPAGRLRQPRQGGRAVGRAAGARRPLPRGRHRGRRRRHPRPHRRGDHRRGDGARRGGGRALGRLGLRAPALLAVARDHRA